MSFKFLFLLIISSCAFGQNMTEESKLEKATLIWGLMKYHHPEVSDGKYNWNAEFITLCSNLDTVSSVKSLDATLLKFVLKFNVGTKFTSDNGELNKKAFLRNVDFGWIENSSFGEPLQAELKKIRSSKVHGNYYAKSQSLNKMLNFENENGFEGFDFEIKSHRALLVANFWNMIQYWYVNKYLTDTPWNQVLQLLVSDFLNANTFRKFELSKLKMTAYLNDSHSYTKSAFFRDSVFNHYPVFGGRIINDSLVITKIFHKELAARDSIQLGDVITHVKGQTISEYIDATFKPILSASNKNYLHHYLENGIIFSNDRNTIDVNILSKHDNISKFRTITLHKSITPNNIERTQRTNLSQVFNPADEILYIDLKSISVDEMSKTMAVNLKKKAIILDLRNYPKNISGNEIVKYLYPDKKQFIKTLFPAANKPSYGEMDGNAPLKLLMDPFKAGTNNANFYKGKVVLLVDRSTMSFAEYIAIMIQQSPSCITIGEQTAGSPLNIKDYTLPDNSKISFTQLGGFYPDDYQAQRNGVKIDVTVKESAKNYNPDGYLDEAVNFINKG